MSGITYAILIGVEYYHESSNFPRVDFATKDVEDLKNALEMLGYETEDIIVLVNEKATKTALEQKIKKITERALENDRIIIYFAGHGFYEGGSNLLAPVDAIKTEKAETCIGIDFILGLLKKSYSRKKILFLDCCHSGFEVGENLRGGTDDFMADDLIYQFSKEEYCVGFASCKSNQKSISLPLLKNGVWSHFLILALTGQAKGIYKEGLLFSDQLQSYLNQMTSEFVKLNTVKKADQTPIKFGNETNKFVIADLNPILERKKMSGTFGIAVPKISIYSGDYDYVKNLPGFQKGYHTVPKYAGPTPNSFIQEIGADLVTNEISKISAALKEKLRYKRKDVRSSIDKGSGSIETSDFDYSITLSQEQNNPDQYVLIRRLENMKSKDILVSAEFNEIFANHFTNLAFYLFPPIDITDLVDKIEALEDEYPIVVEYNPAELDKCRVRIEGLDYKIEVDPEYFSISTDWMTSPVTLVNAFQKARKLIMDMPDLKLLSF